MVQTTMGRLLIDEALPEEMRGSYEALDKKGLAKLLREVAQRYPDKYREVSHALSQVGREVSYRAGGNSFGLRHLRKSRFAAQIRNKINAELDKILDETDGQDDKVREEAIQKLVGKYIGEQQKAVFDESLEEENPLARQVISGSRGNQMNLSSLRGSDMLYVDHHDRPISVPVLSSYSEGLKPAEYWAGTYGARKGVRDVKFATRDAGALAKQLNQLTHRLLVTANDDDDPDAQLVQRGYPVDTDDSDNEGALLAQDTGPYARNTALTPKILSHLKRQGIDRILVRSPIAGGPAEGGVFARDVGVRERGYVPSKGEMVGMTAAQALSEVLSQSQLSSKHSGGVAGAAKGVSGFERINQMVQIPQTFKGGATHAQMDGHVTKIQEAPAGGFNVWVGDTQHYVPQGLPLTVKLHDRIEAGDVLSDGLPNPAEIVQHKGIGEGRRYFVKAFRDAYKGANLSGHRRNIELLSRGLIDHVRLTAEMGDYVPDDIIPYQSLERRYEPREGAETRRPEAAVGYYLEKPYLHHTIGTKVRPSMLDDLRRFGVKDLQVHREPPPFEPEMVRGAASLRYDPDTMTRMLGSNLKSSLLDAVHRGGSSNPLGTSFVPGLALRANFGREGVIQTPAAPTPAQFPSTEPAFGKAAASNPNWSGTEGALSGQAGAVSAPKPAAPTAPKTPAALPTAAKPPAMTPPKVPGASPFGSFMLNQPGLLRPYLQMSQKAGPVGSLMGVGTLLNPSALGTLTRGSARPYQNEPLMPPVPRAPAIAPNPPVQAAPPPPPAAPAAPMHFPRTEPLPDTRPQPVAPQTQEEAAIDFMLKRQQQLDAEATDDAEFTNQDALVRGVGKVQNFVDGIPGVNMVLSPLVHPTTDPLVGNRVSGLLSNITGATPKSYDRRYMAGNPAGQRTGLQDQAYMLPELDDSVSMDEGSWNPGVWWSRMTGNYTLEEAREHWNNSMALGKEPDPAAISVLWRHYEKNRPDVVQRRMHAAGQPNWWESHMQSLEGLPAGTEWKPTANPYSNPTVAL